MGFFVIIFILFFILLISRSKRFIYFLPIVHVIFDMSFTYFNRFSAATYVRGLLLLLFYAIYFKYLYNKKFAWLYVFLVYTSLLVFQSDEFISSLKEYSKILLSMMLLPIAYNYINTPSKINYLNKMALFIIPISLAAVLAGYVFGLGRNLVYTELQGVEENIGLLGSGGLYTGAVAIGILPFLLRNLKPVERKFYIFSSIILYIFILLNVRRTAILIPITGYLMYFITTKYKGRFMNYFIGALFALLVLSPFFFDKLESRYKVRQEKIEGDYTQESRFLENIYLLEKMSSFKEPTKDIFGIGNNTFAEHRENRVIVRRMYHTDTGKLLYAVGFVGVSIYLLFYLTLFLQIIKVDKKRELERSTLMAIFMIFVLLALNGSIISISVRSLLFLYTGAILGTIQNTNALRN